MLLRSPAMSVLILCSLTIDIYSQDTIVFPTIVTGPAAGVGRFEVTLDALADDNAEVCFFGKTNDGGPFTIFILQSTPFDSWCRDSNFGSVGTRATAFPVRDTGELQEGWITLQFDSPATILASIETLILRTDMDVHSGEVILRVDQAFPNVHWCAILKEDHTYLADAEKIRISGFNVDGEKARH